MEKENKLRGCRFREFVRKTDTAGPYWTDYTGVGLFHCWGMSYEEFREDPAIMYSVALVELPDGTIAEVLPTNIKFES